MKHRLLPNSRSGRGRLGSWCSLQSPAPPGCPQQAGPNLLFLELISTSEDALRFEAMVCPAQMSLYLPTGRHNLHFGGKTDSLEVVRRRKPRRGSELTIARLCDLNSSACCFCECEIRCFEVCSED